MNISKKNYKIMRLLVTGGAGFIGSNFTRLNILKPEVERLVVYDKLTYAGNLDNLNDLHGNERFVFVQGDICDQETLEKIIKEFNIDHIINFAAETHVDRSIHVGSREFVLTNVLGTQSILDTARRIGITRMVQVSTDEVYGSLDLSDSQAFTEETPFAPNVPYAAAKAGGDLLCRAYFKTFKVPVIVTHCSNNYGPYQFPEKLIPFFILKAMKSEPAPIYGDGKNVRDWIHVTDHSEALWLLLNAGHPGEVYNIGADNEKNNLEIARIIYSYFGFKEPLLEFVTDRPGHDRRYAIDASKIKKTIGWVPKKDFESGIKDTIQWYLDNSEWVANVTKREKEINAHFQK